ncbi:hypothetical protein V1509DRAFT_550333, partial [Lipomyces kononenkoae]
EATAASLAFKRNNPGYKHHLCLWHTLRAIDQHITGKAKNNGAHSVENARIPSGNALYQSTEAGFQGFAPFKCSFFGKEQHNTLESTYLHFLSDKSDWILEYPQALAYETYEEIHASSVREMLDYCRSISHPRVFRYFWMKP